MSGSVTLDSPLDPSLENEFNYRPLPPLVPVSASFVIFSLAAFAWDLFLVIPVVGTILAILAWRQVAASQGAYSGEGLARATVILLPAILLAAIGLHAYSFATEVPEGFRRVSFASEISEKGFINDNGRLKVPDEVAVLAKEPVFLKGYMYPTKQAHDLKSFVLCKDSGDCCFGGQPKITDMIYVQMAEGKTIDYRTGLVSVAGNFKISPTLDPTGLQPVYRIDCDYFGGAKTSY